MSKKVNYDTGRLDFVGITFTDCSSYHEPDVIAIHFNHQHVVDGRLVDDIETEDVFASNDHERLLFQLASIVQSGLSAHANNAKAMIRKKIEDRKQDNQEADK